MLQNYAIAQTGCAGGELKQIVTNTTTQHEEEITLNMV